MADRHTSYTPGPNDTRFIVCPRCKGRGHFDFRQELPGHPRDEVRYRETRETCVCCDGYRMLEMTSTFRKLTAADFPAAESLPTEH